MTPHVWTPRPSEPPRPPGIWSPDRKLILPGERGYEELKAVSVGRYPQGPRRAYPDRKFGASIDLPAPQAFFRMNGISGAAESDTVGGLTLSNNGTVGSAAGVIGTSRGAFGTNNFLNGASNSIYQITGDWTMAFWFLAGQTGVSKPIIAKTGDSNFPPFLWEWDCEQNNGNNVYWSASPDGNTTSSITSTGGVLNTSTFICAICSFTDSDNKLRVSVNAGTEQVSAAMSSNPHTDTSDMWVGKNHFNFDGWGSGFIDLLAFWNVILTATQRANFYNGGAGREYVSGAWSA